MRHLVHSAVIQTKVVRKKKTTNKYKTHSRHNQKKIFSTLLPFLLISHFIKIEFNSNDYACFLKTF